MTEVSIFVFCSEYRSPVFQYSNIPSLHFLVDSYPLKRVEAKLGISSKEDAIAQKMELSTLMSCPRDTVGYKEAGGRRYRPEIGGAIEPPQGTR